MTELLEMIRNIIYNRTNAAVLCRAAILFRKIYL